MTPTDQLKSMLNEKYSDEDGNIIEINLKPGLTDEQLQDFTNRVPGERISDEIRDLLKFASGFEFYYLEEVTFDGLEQFGFEEMFPHSVQLAGDGFGNFWIMDISREGNWGKVFYVCHDPAVVVLHSENLTEFLAHVHDLGKNNEKSHINIVHEKTVMEIWDDTSWSVDLQNARDSTDKTLKEFASSLPDDFVIADLRNKPIQSGFSWGKFGANTNIVRFGSELLWGLQKPVKKGFFSKIFGR